MKKRLFCVLAALYLMFSVSTAFAAESDIKVTFGGKTLDFNSPPIISENRTLVQIRPIAEAMGLTIEYEPIDSTVIMSDGKTETRFSVGSDISYVDGKKKKMDVKMVLKDDYTFIPIRYLVEPFGYEIAYDEDTKTVSVDISKAKKLAELRDKIRTGSGKYPATYYYQAQEDAGLENNGRGYCWVCSYAMLLSDVTGERVTPNDIAEINISEGYKGNYMSGHSSLVGLFGCKIVPALKETSKYFDSFGTLKKNETKLAVETDEDAYNALKEALDNFPKGVIARFEAYPHSMVAVDYDDDNIYFNDPGIKDGEHKPIEETCLKNYSLSDISYIQAIVKK
ncbi:MAG: copper amine oxidase N-terminal domain-containing protein [Clostridia bacterium]|nr:copper amine oxidase N-terminal domain-containing protein [Clostridia bacterium]